MAAPVLLLHGIWMRGLTMRPLARRLAAAGYAPQILDYASINEPVEAHLDRLRGSVLALADRGHREVHYLGHSLGGVLIAHLLDRHGANLPAGRVVTMGSPLAGSALALRLTRWHLGLLTMGHARVVLTPGLSHWHAPQALGSIAGRLRLGWAMLAGGLPGPHDGTVAVSETRLPGMRDHLVVPASHSGLLLSAAAAQAAIRFFDTGALGWPEAD